MVTRIISKPFYLYRIIQCSSAVLEEVVAEIVWRGKCKLSFFYLPLFSGYSVVI
jgi:hypothetical protein